MQKDNLFESLGEYRDFSNSRRKESDEDKNSEEENYFTEAFKILLQNDLIFTENILSYFINKKGYNPMDILNSEIDKIETQKSDFDSGKKPDMKITLKSGKKFIIENKLRAQQGQNQLSDYIERADFVIFITVNYEDIEPTISQDKKFLGHFYWNDIFEFINDYSKKSDNQWLFKEFLQFMEGKQMDSLKLDRLNKEKLDNFIEISGQIKKISNKIFNFLKENKKYCNKMNNFVKDDPIKIEIYSSRSIILGTIDINDKLAYNLGLDVKDYAVYIGIGCDDKEFDKVIKKPEFNQIKSKYPDLIEDSDNSIFYINIPISNNILKDVDSTIKKFESSGLIKLFK